MGFRRLLSVDGIGPLIAIPGTHHILWATLLLTMGCSLDDRGLGLIRTGTDGSVGTGGGTLGAGGTGGNPGDPGTGGATGAGTGTGGTGTGGAVGGQGEQGGTGGVSNGGESGDGGTAVDTGGQGGSAPISCGPTTCPRGCCNGNTCLTTRTDQACGNSGSACLPCAPCFQCNPAGLCDLDLSALWKMTCVSTVVAPMKPESEGGGTWDPATSDPQDTAPDPFCEFQIKEIGQRDTDPIKNTFTPVWNQTINPPRNVVPFTANWLISAAGSWSILVADNDGMNNEEICQVVPTLTSADFSAGTIAYTTAACVNLTLRLTCDQ